MNHPDLYQAVIKPWLFTSVPCRWPPPPHTWRHGDAPPAPGPGRSPPPSPRRGAAPGPGPRCPRSAAGRRSTPAARRSRRRGDRHRWHHRGMGAPPWEKWDENGWNDHGRKMMKKFKVKMIKMTGKCCEHLWTSGYGRRWYCNPCDFKRLLRGSELSEYLVIWLKQNKGSWCVSLHIPPVLRCCHELEISWF